MPETITIPENPSAHDLVPLLNWVPAGSALELEAKFAQLIAEQAEEPTAAVGGYKPPFSSTYGPTNAWALLAWDNEEDAATWILGALRPNQLRVVARILAGGADGVWTEELRHTAGNEHVKKMSGVFKAIGGRFRSTGHRPVWNGGPKDSTKGQRLSVRDAKAGALFIKVLIAQHPAIAQEYGLS